MTGGTAVPVADLIFLEGHLNSKPVRVLKDDGCNTNVVSRSLLERHRDSLQVVKGSTVLSHSKKGSTETTNQMIVDAELRLGNHLYRSNFVVGDCRYDVLLGMPWHLQAEPRTDYVKPTVVVDAEKLPLFEQNEDCDPSPIVVSALGVKKFRSMLRKKGNREDFQVFQVVQKPEIGNRAMADDAELKALLERFDGTFQDDLPGGLPPERSIDHEIEIDEDAKPPARPLYQLSPAELVAVKQYVADLLKKGKIRRSKSPFGASLFLVKEKDKLRAVVDYRALNRITKRNNTPLPRPDEMFDRLAGACYFSKLDLKTGFHQIRVRPEDIEKTAFNTKYGQFEYLVLPMGLCNAPATFQTLMNQVFHDCIDVFMVVYMDDLLIFSKTRAEHMQHLETVLSRLEAQELYVAPRKCSFLQPETEFLGMIVSRDGIRVNPEKVKVIQDWPKPQSLTELRSFIGLLQFFRRFIKNFSGVAGPLTELTKKGVGIDKWDSTCDTAFSTLKTALVSAPILMAPSWRKPFRCHVDASQRAVGGTLTQLDENGNDRVVAYFSKKLADAEVRYTANERELLGLVYFLKRFRCYLEGSTFEVFTDNQVLKHFFTKPTLNRREARWLDLFAQFGITKVTLKPGRVHVLGDVLSRAPHVMEEIALLNHTSVSVPDAIPFHMDYETDQLFGPIVKGLRGDFPEDKIKLERMSRQLPFFTYEHGKLLYGNKICIPRSGVKEVLYAAHDSSVAGHFGFTKTLSRLDSYHWHHKSRDVRSYVDGCQTCQQKKDSRKKKLGIPNPLDVPMRRWGSLATDFIVKLPMTKRGFDSITTWVDRLSRRVHFLPGRTTDTAVDVANCFFSEIFKLHGLPDSIVSDRDPKFTSKFWGQLMKRCGVTSQMSSTHHPQTDGSSEIMNRMLENYLRCYCSLRQDDWDELLPAAEFAYNSSKSDELQATPFEVDLGWNPRGPLDMLFPTTSSVESVTELTTLLNAGLADARFSHELAKARQAAYSAQKLAPPAYSVGDRVWLSRSLFKDAVSRTQASDKLGSRRFGPFEIVELVGRNALRLDLPPNMRLHPVVHVAHTTPHREAPPDISQPVTRRPDPVPDDSGDLLFEVDRIVAHRKRGRGYQWLTLLKGAPQHEAEWQPTRDFVDDDGTLTKAFRDYIVEHELLRHLH